MRPVLHIRRFGDPACPRDFSAEPARWRLRWHYGAALQWEPRLIVLSESTESMVAKGFTTERMAENYAWFVKRFGMPISTAVRPRLAVSVHACRAVVATRLHEPEREEGILRRLRLRTMAGELLDDPATIAGAARDAGVDPEALARWVEEPEVEAALREDMALARSPSPVALALDHKLADSGGGRRYTAPSYVISRLDDPARTLDVPGFNAVEGYEAAIANLAPELDRRPAPESVEEVLAWAGEPLATAEVALVCGIDRDEAQRRLEAAATPVPLGDVAYWTLAAVPSVA